MNSYELTVVFEADSDAEAERITDLAIDSLCEGEGEGDVSEHVCRNSFVATGPRRLPDESSDVPAAPAGTGGPVSAPPTALRSASFPGRTTTNFRRPLSVVRGLVALPRRGTQQAPEHLTE